MQPILVSSCSTRYLNLVTSRSRTHALVHSQARKLARPSQPRSLTPSLRLLLLLAIRSIIFSFHLLNLLLHLLNLSFPLRLPHLTLPAKQLLIRPSIAPPQPIPKRRILSIIIIKVQMMHRVARRAINNRGVSDVLAVVDEDGPDLDEEEEGQVCEFLQREDEGEDVVGNRLGPAVDGVEGDGGVGGRHDPFVVGFVQGFVDGGVVQAAVDEVDEAVGEEEEEGELEEVVPGEGRFGGCVVELGVAADFGEEEGRGEQGHVRHAVYGLRDLHLDLVLEEFRVLEGGLVEDEDVGEGCDSEVEEGAGEPGIVSHDCRA